MKPKYAAAIRDGIWQARQDAEGLAELSPAHAAAVVSVNMRTYRAMPWPIRLRLIAYQRTFVKAAHDAAMKPAMEQLMEEIRETL